MNRGTDMDMNMSDIKIESNVVMPVVKKRNNYPYSDMRVGDSFKVTGKKMNLMCTLNYRWSKRLSRKFICRNEGDGIRVWRIE